jgi:hypothetical protein
MVTMSYNGLQSIVKTYNPSATYVWCWAHKVSLVVVYAVSSCVEARDLFENLETLYDYVGSTSSKNKVVYTLIIKKCDTPANPFKS